MNGGFGGERQAASIVRTLQIEEPADTQGLPDFADFADFAIHEDAQQTLDEAQSSQVSQSSQLSINDSDCEVVI